MSKILSILFILVWFIFPKISFAAIDFPHSITPQDIYPDTPQITVEITSDQDSFNPNTPYTFKAWNILAGEIKCSVSQFNKNSLVRQVYQFKVEPKKITISWKQPQEGCMSQPGSYKFQAWAGQGNLDRNQDSLISNFEYQIQQQGGQEPILLPLQQTVLLGTKPTVLVSNTRAGNKYSFWWAGSTREMAERISATDANIKNGILSVLLNLSGGTFQAGQSSKICMEIGDYSIPTNVSCHYSTNFTFSPTAPSTNLQCSIIPSVSPTTTDDVSLKITNAIPNTSYITDLNKDGQEYKTINPLSVDTFGTLIIPLGQKMPQGAYQTQVRNIDGLQLLDPCTLGFSVGSGGATIPAATPCTGDNCSKAGGDPCDDARGPGFKTAIGCIHTTPKALVEDVLKFATGIGGGLAFMMMLFGAFQMMTSGGNPQNLQGGRDVFQNAIIGLLFIIFSILLMKIIGIDILSIPGFT